MVRISRSSTLASSFLGPLATLVSDRKHTKLVLPHDRHPPPLFTQPEAAATAAPETGALHAASRHGRSLPPPSPGYTAATPWPSHHWWLRQRAGADASWRGAPQSCGTSGTTPADPAGPLRLGTGCSRDVPPRPRAGGCRG